MPYDWKSYLLKKISGDWSDLGGGDYFSGEVDLGPHGYAMMRIAELLKRAKPGVDKVENIINMAKSIGGLDDIVKEYSKNPQKPSQANGPVNEYNYTYDKSGRLTHFEDAQMEVPDESRFYYDREPVGAEKPSEIPGYNSKQFKSALDRYVADELRYPEEEAARRAGSVQIGVPGREIPFSPGPGSYYSEPWLQAQKIVEQAGGTPGGGTLSVMGGNLAGGDTTESLRRYADEFKRNQTAIKIATIEASAPANLRSEKTNEYLKMLYEQKADEEAQEVAAMNAAANMRQSEANITQSNAYAQYYGGRNAAETEQESIKALADIEIEKIKTKGDLMVQFKDLLATLGGDPVKGGNPQLYVQVLKAIGMAPTPQQAYEDVLKLIGGASVTPGQANLSESDALLFSTP